MDTLNKSNIKQTKVLGQILILVFFMLLVVSALIYGKLHRDLSGLEEQAVTQYSKFTDATTAISNFQSELGYGGFIHHYKNYILYRRLDDLFKADMYYRQSLVSFNLLQATLQDNPQYLEELGVIGSTLNAYSEKLEIFKNTPAEERFTISDREASIDDRQTVTLLKSLYADIQKSHQDALLTNNDKFIEISTYMKQVVFVFLVLFTFLGICLIYLYRLHRETNLELSALMFGAVESYIMSDTDGNILQFNANAHKLFGYSKNEFATLNIDDLVTSGEQGQHKNMRMGFIVNTILPALKKQRATLQPFYNSHQGSFIGRNKNGDMVPVKIDLTAYESGHGLRLLTVLTDQTYIRKLEFKTQIEPFTNLANKDTIKQSLATEIERARRSEHALSLIFIDVDGFKQINDTKGHQFGDKVLINISERINQRVRASDVLGRFGGDEFIIICPECTGLQAAAVAEQIRKNIESFELEGTKITISLGITECQGNDTVKSILERADKALYVAKQGGKNKIKLID